MDINKINKKLNKAYGDRVSATVNKDNRSIVVSGELDNWNDIVEAGYLCVVKDKDYHVVNNIKLSNTEMPKMKLPSFADDALEGDKPDVLIIGGGICGASIARELSRYDINILLVDKESDLAMQTSSRNDGEVHPGVDQKKMNLKLKYELEGNRMYGNISKELDVPFNRCGQYVALKGKFLRPLLEIVAYQKRKLGITDTVIIGKKELYEKIPHLHEGYDCGIYNSSAGVVSPYLLTIAYAENAVSNGARVSLNTAVLDMDVQDGKIISVKTNRGTIYPRLVINAAGVFSDSIAKMAHDQFFSIHPRKGTELILDSKTKHLTDTVVSFKKLFNNIKNTKGGGTLRTVHGNILLGPDAHETYQREDYSTNADSIKWLFDSQKQTIPELSEKDVITYFAGIRAANYEEDFIVEKGRQTDNIIHCAAIQSPGLTAAPAIAKDIEKMAVKYLGDVKRNENFNPNRKAIPCLKEMSLEERQEMIKQNEDYGVIVCRCEEVSKGEIIDCLKSNIPVFTIDAIKRRVRPGMGRCQGGFCSPLVSKIIAEYTGKEIKDITKNGGDSLISYGKTK